MNRNTNVNANRNVNVNVNNNGGCCGGGWDNDYHPVAAAAVVVGTAAVIGSMVRTPPANCVPVNYWRHGLPAVRQHLVPAPGLAVRRRQSALLSTKSGGR